MTMLAIEVRRGQNFPFGQYNLFSQNLSATCTDLFDRSGKIKRTGSTFLLTTRVWKAAKDHLEVAKAIYYTTQESKAHMILSLKPFGCMPSTQSDGAMAQVVSKYKDMIFLPIETSGEGEVNAHSRVQMALG